ncbi:MAG: NUDIX domain-containing protein [Acidimicrobiales bacterium]
MSRPGGGGSGDGRERPSFEMLGEEVVHRGWVIDVTRATFSSPDGTVFERDVVRHPGAVAVVAVTDAGSVVLVHQYRPALDQWLWEIPAGTRDVEGEPEPAVARRELAEEVGWAASRLTLLTRCAITPGFCDERSTVYLATGLTRVALDRQGIEERHMEIEEVPLDRFDSMVDDGTIIDATTILGVGLARRQLVGGEPRAGRGRLAGDR